MIERAPADRQLADVLDRWKELAATDWEITALIAPDQRSVLAFGYRPRVERFALGRVA